MIDAARNVAERLLAGVGTRVAHSRCVAAQAGVAAAALDGQRRELAQAAGWLHDIGYSPEARATGLHQLDGARWLRGQGFDDELCSLVAWHTCAQYETRERGLEHALNSEFERPEQTVLDALSWADLTSSPTGEPMEPTDRVQDMLDRYPSDSPVHKAISAAKPELMEIARRVEESLAVGRG